MGRVPFMSLHVFVYYKVNLIRSDTTRELPIFLFFLFLRQKTPNKPKSKHPKIPDRNLNNNLNKRWVCAELYGKSSICDAFEVVRGTLRTARNRFLGPLLIYSYLLCVNLFVSVYHETHKKLTKVQL